MTRLEILKAAESCIMRERAQTYGDAEKNFGLIAQFWSDWLGQPVSVLDVPMMMAQMKAARIKANPGHMDSWVDLIGFIALGGEIASRLADGADVATDAERQENLSEAIEPKPEADESPVAIEGAAEIPIEAAPNAASVGIGAPDPAPVAQSVPPSPFARVWTADEDRRLLEMRDDRHSYDKIAETLGRTPRACEQRMARLTKRAGASNKTKMALPRTAPTTANAVAAPPAPPPPAAVPAGLTSSQRGLVLHLDSLDDNFSPEDDLAIIEGLAKGMTARALAADMDCSAVLVGERWRAMLQDSIADRHGRITIDGRRDLLAAARARIEAADA